MNINNISIESCGYHTHNTNKELIFRPEGTSSYLFLLVLSPMTFYFSSTNIVRAKSGACILFPPNTKHHYQAENTFFNSYIHFFCPPTVVAQFGIPENKLFYPQNTEEVNWIIKKIHTEVLSDLMKKNDMISCYIIQLLTLLQRDCLGIPPQTPRQLSEIYTELEALRDGMLRNCKYPWTINELCDMLGIGKSQLYKYYHSFFQSSPMEELLKARIQKAKYLLTSSTRPINEVAYESGFRNINHFNRLFKSQCGCTPGAFRKGK